MAQQSPPFLAPVSLGDFFTHYWEKQPLHITRDGGEITELIDLPAIERLFSTQPLYFPGVQLTQSGKTIAVSSYADEQSVILPLRLFELHAQGATIVLSQAQKLFAPLNDLCREVMRTLKMDCQANVYVSAPANQGFNAHYDTHDVFVLQVSGAKTFNFYASPVHLPFPDEQFDANKLNATPINSTPIDESIRLTAGDTLYIPRGIVHDAIADDTDPSIHITLGVYPVLMRDVLLKAVHYQASQDHQFRKSLNPFITSDEACNDVRETLMALLQQAQKPLSDTASFLDLMAGFQDALAIGAPQDCTGLSQRLGITCKPDEPLPVFKRLLLRPELIIDFRYSAPCLKIHTFGQIMEFNDPVSSVMLRLLEQGLLDQHELRHLGVDHSEAMVRRLLQENLVDVE